MGTGEAVHFVEHNGSEVLARLEEWGNDGYAWLTVVVPDKWMNIAARYSATRESGTWHLAETKAA